MGEAIDAVLDALTRAGCPPKRHGDAWSARCPAHDDRDPSLSIGPINGINKKGWEYLWVRHSDQEDTAAKALVKRPIAAYVERVYESGSFAALQLG
jgi:hypothetical protein